MIDHCARVLLILIDALPERLDFLFTVALCNMLGNFDHAVLSWLIIQLEIYTDSLLVIN